MPLFQRVAHFEVNLDRELGSGGFGSVYFARDTSSGAPIEVAAKRVRYSGHATRQGVRKEVDVMRLVGGHVSIIALLHFEEEDHAAWIFLEYATGGELFDRLIDSGNLSERATRPYARALLKALAHCHERGIVHRDIKLENVLLCAEDPHALKLVDFGLALQVPQHADGSFDENHLCYDGVGSRSYKAPEMFAAGAGYAPAPVDSWAVGITLFSLLSGFFPFDVANSTDWRFTRFAQQVASGVPACDALFGTYRRPCHLTAPCKELVDQLLSIDPRGRLTIAAAARHEWLAPEPEAACVDGGGGAEEVVYRSLHGDSAADGLGEPFELPPDAMRVQRQRAEVDVA